MVAPNAIENDDILLSSLEGIHSIDFDSLGESAVLASAKRTKSVLNVSDLGLVRRDYTDLTSDVLYGACL